MDFHDVIFDETSVVNHTSGSQTDYIWFAEEFQKSENEQLLSLDVQEDVPEQNVHEYNIRRNNHIDITYRFVREVTSNGYVYLRYVPTSQMVADMLNKPLDGMKVQNLRSICGAGSVDRSLGYE